MTDITNNDMELAAAMLDMAADNFGNHGYNDFEFPAHWTQQECDDYSLAMDIWNDPEDGADEHEPGGRHTADFFVMGYLAAKFREAAWKSKQD